jgi:hypothetical protein
MPVVIAAWPDGTVSVVSMNRGFSATDLYCQLDAEGDPLLAKCYVISRAGDRCFHIGTRRLDEWELPPADGYPERKKVESIEGRAKKFAWPKRVVRDYYRSLSRTGRASAREIVVEEMHASDIRQMPRPPDPQCNADEIKKLPAFSGVYVAWNDDGTVHYVGESTNVPSRVSRARPEIGDRRIGFVACPPQDRKRIECFFIGILDPPGNSQSTHRTSASSKSRPTT